MDQSVWRKCHWHRNAKCDYGFRFTEPASAPASNSALRGVQLPPNEIAMVENQVGSADTDSQPDSEAGKEAVDAYRKKFSFRWDFWNNHAIAFWAALVGGLLM